MLISRQSHNCQTFTDVVDEQNGLLTTYSMSPRHSRQDGIDLKKTVRRAGNILFAETGEHVQTCRMVRMIAIEYRHQNRSV